MERVIGAKSGVCKDKDFGGGDDLVVNFQETVGVSETSFSNL